MDYHCDHSNDNHCSHIIHFNTPFFINSYKRTIATDIATAIQLKYLLSIAFTYLFL
jgi:hypothetical protein